MAVENNLRVQITDILAEEIGILADVVIDEVMNEMGITGPELSSHLAGKFVRVLNQKLPTDTDNRQTLMRDIGQILLQKL